MKVVGVAILYIVGGKHVWLKKRVLWISGRRKIEQHKGPEIEVGLLFLKKKCGCKPEKLVGDDLKSCNPLRTFNAQGFKSGEIGGC